MPRLTRWFVKTSFIYLALALTAGLRLAIQSTFDLITFGGLFPVHIHLLVFGWLTQLIFGKEFRITRPSGISFPVTNFYSLAG